MDPKDLIIRIAQALVDHPEQISINEIEGGNTIIVELKVAKGDLGKIIGQQGRNVNAIRTILNGLAGKTEKRLKLVIVE